MSSVWRLFVTRVYCDKTAKLRIIRFSLICSSTPWLFSCQVWWRNSRESLWSGAQIGWGGFQLRDAISEMVQSRALWAFDCNKSRWPWMTLNANLLLCRQCCAYCDHVTKRLRLESRGFCYKVALYLGYQQIKFKAVSYTHLTLPTNREV